MSYFDLFALRSAAMSSSPTTLGAARSYLFVPATDLAVVRKAEACDADVVIVDLEDAVAERSKETARKQVETLTTPRAHGQRVVRVNGPLTAHGKRDLDALAGVALDGVMVPGATPATLAALAPASWPLIALVESAIGLRDIHAVAQTPGVAALMIGTVDLALELDLVPGPDGIELLSARSQLVLAARCADLPAPIDGVWTALGDSDGLRAEAQRARALGFGAKACIHPRQLAIVHEAFSVGADERAWAERVLHAYEQAEREGLGAVQLDGQMIDLPVVNRARRAMQRSER